MNLDLQFGPFSPPNTNLLEQLRYWSVAVPEKIAFRFLSREEDDPIELTFSQLDHRARAIAARLTSLDLAGKRALLMYPPGLDFIESFFGCIYAGVVPVPAYPPGRNRNLVRINAISLDAQASVALTVKAVSSRSNDAHADAGGLRKILWVDTDEIPNELADDWIKPRVSAGNLGLIQYTSGSTGSPKGVVLTHQNIMANTAMIMHAFGMTRQKDRGVFWLPTYHDMGLIGGVVMPACFAAEITFLSPVTFLTRPLRWLRAISDYQAAISGGTNFAYRWCTMKIKPEECENLDLSSWKVAFNGAEPVRADVLKEFSRKFEPYGFDHASHYPCYGMAETAFIVTGGKSDQEPVIRSFDKDRLMEYKVQPVADDVSNARQLVGSGQIIPTENVIIVDPEKRSVQDEKEIGEIWINSPSAGRVTGTSPKNRSKRFAPG